MRYNDNKSVLVEGRVKAFEKSICMTALPEEAAFCRRMGAQRALKVYYQAVDSAIDVTREFSGLEEDFAKVLEEHRRRAFSEARNAQSFSERDISNKIKAAFFEGYQNRWYVVKNQIQRMTPSWMYSIWDYVSLPFRKEKWMHK